MSARDCTPEDGQALVDHCDAIDLIIAPRDKDLGGFSVRRMLPFVKRRSVGPWVFFDHMGPATLLAGPGVNVRPHPHINLATVTYLFEGEIFHRDSLGNAQAIVPGDVNLMVAGKGIVHSERERPERIIQERGLNGLQLWHALPEKDEETDPAFYHYPGQEIPSVTVDDIPVRVIMGKAYNTTSPVKTYAETLYIEADLNAGQQLTLPLAKERAIYTVSGSITINDTQIPTHHMAILGENREIKVEARESARIAVIGGEPLGQRFMEWNFISSRKERIEQAKTDWKTGNFPKVPGDSHEYIPLP